MSFGEGIAGVGAEFVTWIGRRYGKKWEWPAFIAFFFMIIVLVVGGAWLLCHFTEPEAK